MELGWGWSRGVGVGEWGRNRGGWSWGLELGWEGWGRGLDSGELGMDSGRGVRVGRVGVGGLGSGKLESGG